MRELPYSDGVDSVAGYTTQIDRLLAAACTLFPAGDAPVHGDAEASGSPQLPEGRSGLGAAVGAAVDTHGHITARAIELHELIGQTMRAAAADARGAGTAAAGVRQAAHTAAAAINGATSAPDGTVLLVASMDERLAAMQGHIGDTRQRLGEAAARLAQHTAELAALSPTNPED